MKWLLMSIACMTAAYFLDRRSTRQRISSVANTRSMPEISVTDSEASLTDASVDLKIARARSRIDTQLFFLRRTRQ